MAPAFLEEIRDLPSKVVAEFKEFENLKVYLVQDFNLRLLTRMVNFGLDIFGELGTDEWGLVPQIRHGNVFLLKEEDKKRIIGLAILMRDWEDLDKAYLFDFAIADDFRGRGLGYHFLVVICQNLKDQGFKRLSLTVDVNNKAAVHLYRDKLGFQIARTSDDEYGKGHDRHIMELHLTDAPKPQH
ncbi:MAG TPA: GNAT family N-acetyltransferase [Bacillota bacterium]